MVSDKPFGRRVLGLVALAMAVAASLSLLLACGCGQTTTSTRAAVTAADVAAYLNTVHPGLNSIEQGADSLTQGAKSLRAADWAPTEETHGWSLIAAASEFTDSADAYETAAIRLRALVAESDELGLQSFARLPPALEVFSESVRKFGRVVSDLGTGKIGEKAYETRRARTRYAFDASMSELREAYGSWSGELRGLLRDTDVKLPEWYTQMLERASARSEGL